MRKFVCILTLLFVAGVLSAKKLEKGGAVDFTRRNHISLPTYDWPRTLLSYPVEFEGGISAPEELCLTNNLTSEAEPFQLSKKVVRNGRIMSAQINFFATLPSGGEYSFTLKRAPSEKAENPLPLTWTQTKDGTELRNGLLSVTIPHSADIHASVAPAFIVAKQNRSGINSRSALYTGSHKVASIKAMEIECGELFAQYQVEYRFEDGGVYCQDIKLVSGYPFVILNETIEGISSAEDVRMEMEWCDFNPLYRFPLQWDRVFDNRLPWYRIDEPVYTNYCREDPSWTGRGALENPAEKMLFRLTPFGGNSVREQVPLISFWEEGGDELGIFVYDHDKWDDRQYGIWQQSPDLSVYFSYADNTLKFTYPLSEGTRSTAIAIHPVMTGDAQCNGFDKAIDAIGGSMKSRNTAYRYTNLLHSRYSLLDLNKVKDWQLEYPAKGKRGKIPFQIPLQKGNPESFVKEVKRSCMAYYMMGANGFPGVHSIEHRNFYGRLTQGYLDNYLLLEEDERKQVESLFLMAGYVNMGEAMNAIRTCLAGTANMAADGWAVTGVVSALFPEHAMSSLWADYFEKSLEIYGLFYTRPDVDAYESKGGRWVESMGIYNWAYFKPTVAANLALCSTGRENAFADRYMVQRGRWMVDMLTAPVNVKTKSDAAEQLQRVYTAHGAHSGGRFVEQFSYVYQLGRFLENYDPLQAEHLYWCRRMGVAPEGKPADSNWDKVFTKTFGSGNNGTNPHLKSEKYTGHGIVLRAGVDTPEELSIHLDQTDKGPNYRWGNQGDGHSGGLYFYAGGKIFCGHENEAAGDHTQNDTDGVTNFGVMKGGAFRSIGHNELSSPMYDLGIAQFAEVRSTDGDDRRSWPEYLSRSVMLVGTDYFLLYDETGTNWRAYHRFSWFTQKKDELPKIIFFGNQARKDHWTIAQTDNSRGFYRDNYGSLLTLVTHKDDVTTADGALIKPNLLKEERIYEHRNSRKGLEYEGIHEIKTANSRDFIFRNGRKITCEEPGYCFEGNAGLIRKMKSGEIQLAIFKGSRIGVNTLNMELDAEKECAVAISFANPSYGKGRFKNYGKAGLKIRGIRGGTFYIDGFKAEMNGDTVVLPEGEHTIEYTAGNIIPMPSYIVGAEYIKRGARIEVYRSSTAGQVMLELSKDGGNTWEEVGICKDDHYELKNLKKGKYHVRAVSVNGDKRAEEAPEYPVYVNDDAPHHPEGLRVMLEKDKVNLSWGQVLGVEKYILYRKDPSGRSFKAVYEGYGTSYTDKGVKGVVPCDIYPSDFPGKSYVPVYEYYVVAANGRGSSKPSPIVDTNPSLWANWYPKTELKFKRTSAFWMEPYVHPNEVPERYYPN